MPTYVFFYRVVLSILSSVRVIVEIVLKVCLHHVVMPILKELI